MDGLWHQSCLVWKNEFGTWKFYEDGIMKGSGSGLQKDYVIPDDGTLFLGQDQDKYQGGFDSSQAFDGYLSEVNVWDNVLSEDVIHGMSQNCHSNHGNVFQWFDFKNGVQGNAQVKKPSICEPAE